MESLSYLEIFRQRWLAIVAAVVLGVGIATIVAFSIPPTYTATATLFLSVKDANATLAERSQFPLTRVNSYTDLVRSSDVLQPVIDELGLNLTVQQLANQVSATNPSSTVNIDITARARSGESAAAISNAVADSLSTLVASVENFGSFSVSLDRLIPAFAPNTASAPQKNVILGLGGISGLAIGAIAALALARFDPRIRSVRDVRRASGLAVLGAIPRRRPSRKANETEAIADAAMADAILRIRQANAGVVPRMLLLLPAGRKSGPAWVRLGLTEAVAATGRDVLLVETDPTDDQSSPLSQFEDDEGLSELLGGTTTARTVERTLEGSFIRVIPAGVSPTTEVQAEKSFRSVMTELLSAADVIIAQATSATRPAAIPLIAPYADVSVVLVRHNVATDRDLAQAVSQLRIVGVRPIGVVMVDVPPRRHIDLSASWRLEDFATKPFKALISPRRAPATRKAQPKPSKELQVITSSVAQADAASDELDIGEPSSDSTAGFAEERSTDEDRVVAD